MDACLREALALEGELAGRSPEFRRIHESWAKSRDDMRAWFRVAELSFDNYLAQAAARR
jgi:TRAP-type mannitol/chloroaromatic compound transport system substrate-binding protein